MSERSLNDLGPPERQVPSYFLNGALWGLLSGWGLIFVPYIIVLIARNKSLAFLMNGTPEWIYNGSILLLMPLVQGLAAGLVRGRQKQSIGSGFLMVAVLWAADTAIASIFLREGVICLLMGAPLLLAIIAIGYGVGRGLARLRRAKTLSVSLAPLALFAVVAETQGPPPNHPAVVVDSITVQAPPEYVWRYIVDYPDNPNPPDYWL